ncbi:helix-turn-helix domain-containing protein, partial [Haemophilus influenzae]
VEICIERNWQGFNASWDWRDEKLRTSQAQKMSFEEKNALPWNRPEDWENVL